MTRQNEKRSGKNSGGGGPNGGGGKRGIPIKGWEKGDIVRDIVSPVTLQFLVSRAVNGKTER